MRKTHSLKKKPMSSTCWGKAAWEPQHLSSALCCKYAAFYFIYLQWDLSALLTVTMMSERAHPTQTHVHVNAHSHKKNHYNYYYHLLNNTYSTQDKSVFSNHSNIHSFYFLNSSFFDKSEGLSIQSSPIRWCLCLAQLLFNNRILWPVPEHSSASC